MTTGWGETKDAVQVKTEPVDFTAVQLGWIEQGQVDPEEVELAGEILRNPVQPEHKRQGLPPHFPSNCFWGDDGLMWHQVWVMSEGGSYVLNTRPLASTREEAIDLRRDYYHPTLGLIWDGYKLARDRSAQDRMNDRSQTLARPGGRAIPFAN